MNIASSASLAGRDRREKKVASVEFTEEGNVAIITLNRPEKLNAVNRTMVAELNAAMSRYMESDHLRAAVYCSNGRSFSAGVDLADVQAAFAEPEGPQRDAATKAFDIAFEEAEFWDKPIIAAIQGQCCGVGLTSSLACDLRIAAEDAVIIMPEIKFGVASVHGNLRMVQMAGYARTMEMLLTGEARSAQWALDAGLINEIVPAGEERSRAIAIAHTIASFDPSIVYNSRKVGALSQWASFDETVAQGVALRKDFTPNAEYVHKITGRSAARGAEANA